MMKIELNKEQCAFLLGICGACLYQKKKTFELAPLESVKKDMEFLKNIIDILVRNDENRAD
jgi:hypothetical protein